MAKRRCCAGEKGAGEARPAPARAGGGRTESLSWLKRFGCPHPTAWLGGNGKAVTVTSLPLCDRARRTTLPPQWGCPPRGIGGGGLGLGAGRCEHHAGRGRWGGAIGTLSPAAGAWRSGQGKGRKLLTSDNTLRLVAQCGPGPLCQVPAAEPEPEHPQAQWQLPGSRRRNRAAQWGSPVPTAAAGVTGAREMALNTT